MNEVLLFLATNYHDFEKRATITELDLANKGLRGKLDFTHLGFTNLRKLKCQGNYLTKLTIDISGLDYLNISDNKIVALGCGNNLKRIEQMDCFDISNNPLSDRAKKKFLQHRWQYWKNVVKLYPDLLVPEIMKIVDTSDFDDFIANYDYDRESEQDYHRICGGKFASLNEFSLANMSQQILARALIKQNQLINGVDENYEKEINNLASQFQKTGDFYNQYPLKVLQRELTRQLLGEKDLVREFQQKLLELEKLCDPNISIDNETPVNFDKIKETIIKLQNITRQQKEHLSDYQKLVNEKETAQQSSNQQLTETLTELTNSKKYSQNLQERLTIITNQEQNSQQRISELEKNGVLGTKELKEELKKLIEEKQELIQKLKDLQADNKDLELKIADTSFDFKKWGLITFLIIVVIGGIWWFYRWVKKFF